MELPKVDLDVLRTIPIAQKIALVAIVLGLIWVMFYFYYFEPQNNQIIQLDRQIEQFDKEIQTLTLKVKHMDEIIAANKQLEIEIAKKKERLPPKEEAIMLLKQLTDLGIRLGLDVKVWRPGKPSLHNSKLYVKMPVKVEVAGGYHTVAMFFDRVGNLPRIVNVSDLKMGSPKIEEGRVVIQTVFGLTAFAAP